MIHWQPGLTLAQVEKEALEKALMYFKWNKTMTARALNISVRTIDNKIKKYKIANTMGER